MAVKYVKDFEFPADFGFHKPGNPGCSVPGKAHYAKGGHVKASTPQPYRLGGKVQGPQKKPTPPVATQGMGAKAEKFKMGNDKAPPATRTEKSSGVQKPAFKKGGSTTPYKYKDGGSIEVAHGKVKDGKKTPWSPDDATSPGSPKRTPPGQGVKNKAAASNKFATDGENTEPATKQTGDVERMSGFSDFKKGGKVKHNPIKNLGHYAHGGKVAAKYEKAAGTPKASAKAHAEVKSGAAKGKHTEKAQGEKRANVKQTHPKATHSEKSGKTMSPHAGAEPHMASGGLGRSTSHKKNAAIHAKMKHQGPAMGALAGLLGAQGAAHQPPAPGMGPPPPGMAPGMGAPPGGQMGGMAPPPGGAMGPGGMSHGGGVKHVIVHHVSHKA